MTATDVCPGCDVERVLMVALPDPLVLYCPDCQSCWHPAA